MNAHDVISQMLDTARFVTNTYLADMSDQDLLVPPITGAHTAAWQLGHLILSECGMLDTLASGSAPALPEGFAKSHSKESEFQEASTGFLGKAAYVELAAKVRLATRELLAKFSADQLSIPGPEGMRSYAPTVGSIFLMIGSHEILHSGQLAVIRRKLGKPVVI